MRMLVLGAGCRVLPVRTICSSGPEVERVTLRDLHPRRAAAFLKKRRTSGLSRAPRCEEWSTAAKADARARRSHERATVLFQLSGRQSGRCHGPALRGSGRQTRDRPKAEDAARGAQKKRVSIIPDCGLAPGMVNIIAAEGIRRVGDAESVKILWAVSRKSPSRRSTIRSSTRSRVRSTITRRRRGCCARAAPSVWMLSPSSRTWPSRAHRNARGIPYRWRISTMPWAY